MSKLQEFIANGDYIPVAKTNSDPTYTATTRDLVLADSSGGVVTVNLPASPQAGDRVVFVDSKKSWGTNNLTVGRNGSNIDGAASDYTADGASGSQSIIEMIYSGNASNGWLLRTSGAATSYVAGAYGYFAGGRIGSATPTSNVERITFPFDSGTASNTGTLTQAEYYGMGFNSSVYGYHKAYTPITTTITRFTFPLDGGTLENVGNLTTSIGSSAAFNSSSHGYFMAGYNSITFQSSIWRFAFPFDSGTAGTVGTITSGSRNSLSGCNSSTHGFGMGGGSPNEPYNFRYSTINRITFPHDSGTASTMGSLSDARANGCGCNSSDHGFMLGGGIHAPSSARRSQIDRLAFPFDSGNASHVGNLSDAKNSTSSVNSSNHGFVSGGDNQSVVLSVIDRIVFPFASGTASHVGNLSATFTNNCGIDETDFINMFV
jgi:hypothetical protein